MPEMNASIFRLPLIRGEWGMNVNLRVFASKKSVILRRFRSTDRSYRLFREIDSGEAGSLGSQFVLARLQQQG
jgi:hypothetical protein